MTVHFLTFNEHILCARYNVDLKFYLNNFEMNMLDKVVPICHSNKIIREFQGQPWLHSKFIVLLVRNLLPDEFCLSLVSGAVIRP